MKLKVTFDENQQTLATTFDSTSDSFQAEFGDTTEVVNPYAVLYTPQELTEEQQAQVRENIGIVEYTLPVATDSTLGGVMVGDGLTIDENGVLQNDREADKTFVYEQMSASSVWTIEHNLGKYPSVDVVDSAGTVVVGEVEYIDSNNIQITFVGAFSGTAYLN